MQYVKDFTDMQKKLHKVSIISLMTSLSFFLYACATPKPPEAYVPNKAQISLSEASYSVSRSIVDLAETAEAAHPRPRIESPPAPASYGMGGLTSVDWSGPVEPLVKQIATAANYRFKVLGTQPGIPIIVTIYTKNAMLGDVLRDVGYQCGRRATVTVYADTRVIELSYAKN
jgi:defect-in-organelle-trafficking protein DotD